MSDPPDSDSAVLHGAGWPKPVERIRARTPARVLVDRAGAAYRTSTQLELRQAHAAARDAVRTELEMDRDLGAEFVRQWKLFEVFTLAKSKDEYLLRPDLGRKFDDNGRERIRALSPPEADLQIVIGDGLSVTALATQVPRLLPKIMERAAALGWTLGQPFVAHHCRVGVMNDVGELLHPEVVVLLIGERPGLATAESLSAYMAFQPRAGQNDSGRNLISNIHARGVPVDVAAARIVSLSEQMMQRGTSGVGLKEKLPPPGWMQRIGG
ncbi:MAG TPA: ethanolamine ammonia-lyase subunit EutC [Verrucomicrobiae bacterium]|jgi:ethanolamine ammonia-lyase small subunit|nr:ethanolamine ammonia-lyase subunit EutC [Verrucomicrobiae bacterium]